MILYTLPLYWYMSISLKIKVDLNFVNFSKTFECEQFYIEWGKIGNKS